MNIDELSLPMIADQMRLTTNREIVKAVAKAVAYAARLGWADTTCFAFVTALVMTDNLRNPGQWPVVLRKISDLKIAADLASLKEDRMVTREIE